MDGLLYGMKVLDDDGIAKLVGRANELEQKVGLLEAELPDMAESDGWDNAKKESYGLKATEHGRLTTMLTAVRSQLRDQVELRRAYEAKVNDRRGDGPKSIGPLARYLSRRSSDWDDEVKANLEDDYDGGGFKQFVIKAPPPSMVMPGAGPYAAVPDITRANQANDIFEERMPGIVERLAYVGSIRPMVYTFMTSDGNPRSFIGLDTSAEEGELETPEAKDVYANPAAGGFAAPSKKTFNAFTVWTKPVWESENAFTDVMYLSDAFIANKLYNRLERGSNTQYVNGAGGNSAPQGIVSTAKAGITAAATDAVTYSELVNLEYKIDEAYLTGDSGLVGPGAGPDVRSGGEIGYIFSRDFERLARTMTDDDGRPLWQLDLTVGAMAVVGRPALFMGRPYRTNSKLDAVAAGKIPLLFGNFSYFGIRTVNGLYVRSFYDSFTAINGNILFLGRMRTDSDTIGAVASGKCEAYVKLTMKA